MRSGLDEVLVEGDIVMTPEQARHYFGVDSEGRRSKRQAYQPKGFPKSLWKDGVYYTFDPRLNQKTRDVVHSAVAFWQANTCIKFTETADVASSPVKPVIVVSPGVGCNSMLGRKMNFDDSQTLNLEPGKCEYFAAATHELAHALGFIHEHTRWDRDEYIYVDLTKLNPNISQNYDKFDVVDQYKKYDKAENDNYGKQYDFGGIMHYDDTAGAIAKGDIVMLAKNPDYQMTIGGAVGPVYGDVYEMNMLYSCYDRCKNSGTVCKHEGMPNPNNCSVCQCPSGFGGDDCSQRQAGNSGFGHDLNCGDTLTAEAHWQTLDVIDVVGAGNYNSSYGNASNPYHCTWHITAPAGKVVEYEVIAFGTYGHEKDVLCTEMCYFGGLKIKGQEDSWKPEGMKLCCSNQLNKIRITTSNLLVIQAYNHLLFSDFAIEYRISKLMRLLYAMESWIAEDAPPKPTKSTAKSTTTTTTTRRTTSSGCPAGYDILSSTGTICYNVNVRLTNFMDASLSCLRTNGSISIAQATVDETILKNIFIKKAKSSRVSKYWSGLKNWKCGIYDINLNTYTYTSCLDLSKKAGYFCQFKLND
uniref:Zinc metalloproteinase n=1 Tax=Steinernema glaseri TaxID=37863 RepID=A0A1I7YBN2_9BILA